jgi:hypothetical protein
MGLEDGGMLTDLGLNSGDRLLNGGGSVWVIGHAGVSISWLLWLLLLEHLRLKLLLLLLWLELLLLLML